ncbi:MAG: hypothetical protein EBZ59_12320, partial [Planctomycetia bacterium]|nr:hypothetical protein [Planctomycetia bacterium]
MAEFVKSPATRTAGGTINPYRLVKESAGNVIHNTAGGSPSGLTQELPTATVASGGVLPVLGRFTPGIVYLEASGAISAGGRFYAAASGKISATASGRSLGFALDSASADGDVIRVVLTPHDDTYASSFTLTSTEAAAGSGNGQVDFDTGFGVTSFVAVVNVLASTGAPIAITKYTVTQPGSTNAGKVRVTGVTTGDLVAGNVVNVIAMRAA